MLQALETFLWGASCLGSRKASRIYLLRKLKEGWQHANVDGAVYVDVKCSSAALARFEWWLIEGQGDFLRWPRPGEWRMAATIRSEYSRGPRGVVAVTHSSPT